MRLVEPERSDAQPAQRREVREPAQRDTEIGGERPDVGAAAALDQRGGGRVGTRLELLDVEAVDPHVPRRPLHFLAFQRELVQPTTTDLHRRDHRRQLLDVAEELRGALCDLVAREHHRSLVEHCARRVERGGGDAEHDTAPVGLGRLLEESQQARRAAQPDQQHTGGVGVEGARVPDASLPVRRGATGRRRRDSSSPRACRRRPGRHARSCRSGTEPQSDAEMRATNTEIGSGDENPAANR